VSTIELVTIDATASTPPVTSRRRAWRRLLRNPLGLIGLMVVAAAILAALLASVIAPFPPDQVNFKIGLTPPSPSHWFGTDELGRDQLSRVLFGLRVSLTVSVLSIALSFVVGVPLGLLSGFYRRVDPVVSRFTDLLLAFPFLVLAVGLAAILGASLFTATLAIGIGAIPAIIRVTRSETLRLRGLDFVAAAVADGASDPVVLFRHVLPNAVNTLIVQATVAAPAAIIGEAVLSFLGVGVGPPTASLGVMLASAQRDFRDGPWLEVFPGVAIIVVTLALNLLGDGLRDALDPRETPR
jgi:ABC-type dipeptide/oligopeptide/nickel transport system permease subunit